MQVQEQGSEKKARHSPVIERKPEPLGFCLATARRDDAAVGAADDQEHSYFAVNLFVAALGDGKLILEGARKKQDVLEQIVRNVSKEQNTVVHVPSDGTTMHLKMRVFVENSIEAKAVIDYIASHPHQALLLHHTTCLLSILHSCTAQSDASERSPVAPRPPQLTDKTT